jgi:transketolase
MVASEQTLLTSQQIAILSINTIRTLAIDAVQKANSGHPGAPMGLAPVAYSLWQQFLRYDPADPLWPNRDRFVLSNGHASMLLYAMLYLSGVKAVNQQNEIQDEPAISIEDIKKFRQLGSKTPGHPEYGHTTGVETTTGPLGQGVGNSLGMAITAQWLAARYNRPGFRIFDYNVYAMCGDGDMMEGVGSEAASLAGHLKLPNLCWIYDNNRVTLDGPADWSFTEDVAARFLAYGWHVTHVTDANDLTQASRAYNEFLQTTDRPTLIVVNSRTSKIQMRRTVSLWERMRSAWSRNFTDGQKMQSSSFPMACWKISNMASANAVANCIANGIGCSWTMARSSPISQSNSTGWSGGNFLTIGTKIFQLSPPMRKEWQRAKVQGKC